MLGEFTVKDVGSTAPLPDTDASIEPSEYKFDVSGLKAGENTITFANKGKQFHHVIAVPLADGATLDEAVAFLSSEGEGARTRPPPVDFEKEQDVAVTGPGEAQVVTHDVRVRLVRLLVLHLRQGRRSAALHEGHGAAGRHQTLSPGLRIARPPRETRLAPHALLVGLGHQPVRRA